MVRVVAMVVMVGLNAVGQKTKCHIKHLTIINLIKKPDLTGREVKPTKFVIRPDNPKTLTRLIQDKNLKIQNGEGI